MYFMRNMTSWANKTSISLAKKKEPTIRFYYSSPSEDYASSTLSFLYSIVFCQKSAEAFYAHDAQGFFQPILKGSPVIHYIKELPSSGTNLYTELYQAIPVLSPMSYANLKRNIRALYELNQETSAKIDAFLSNFSILRQAFDVGLVLEQPEDVANSITGLKALQKRVGKKGFRIFVMTEDIELVRQFAQQGDPSWSYVSLLRKDSPTDKQYTLLKRLSEIQLIQKTDFLAVRLGSPLGKLLFLLNEKVNSESQVVSLDKTSWKAFS